VRYQTQKGRVNIKCLRKINRDEILLLPAEETLDFIAFVHLRQVTGANAVMYGTLATCPLCGYKDECENADTIA
jgi:hypothetical protein